MAHGLSGQSVDYSGKFQPLWDNDIRADTEQPPVDATASAVETAYRKGYEDGQASAEATFKNVVEQERRNAEAQLRCSQEAQLLEALRALSLHVTDALSGIAMQIGDDLARALSPFISQRLTDLETEKIMSALARVLDVNGVVVINLKGPESLIQPLADHLEERGLKVMRDARDLPELLVKIDEFELRSAVPHWIARLQDIVK